jgi:hypothetical protein
MSGWSLIPMKQVMKVAPRTWFQAYLSNKQEQMDARIGRVARAGFETLVITVDTPSPANRKNNVRAGFRRRFSQPVCKENVRQRLLLAVQSRRLTAASTQCNDEGLLARPRSWSSAGSRPKGDVRTSNNEAFMLVISAPLQGATVVGSGSGPAMRRVRAWLGSTPARRVPPRTVVARQAQGQYSSWCSGWSSGSPTLSRKGSVRAPFTTRSSNCAGCNKRSPSIRPA